jgi:hypothetical protein
MYLSTCLSSSNHQYTFDTKSLSNLLLKLYSNAALRRHNKGDDASDKLSIPLKMQCFPHFYLSVQPPKPLCCHTKILTPPLIPVTPAILAPNTNNGFASMAPKSLPFARPATPQLTHIIGFHQPHSNLHPPLLTI